MISLISNVYFVVLPLLLLRYVTAFSEINPTTHDIEFDVTSNILNSNKRIISINGNNKTYGPVINMRAGDTLHLTVKNHICSPEDLKASEDDQLLKEYCTTTIHFHGLIGIGNENDGVPYVTQDPIQPNEVYIYNITIPKDTCGTFWYHSHTSVQYGDGLRGVLIINCDRYDKLANNIISSLSTLDLENIKPNSYLSINDPFGEDYNLNDISTEEKIVALSDTYDYWGLDILKNDVVAFDGTPDPRLTGSTINGKPEHDTVDNISGQTRYLKLRIINSGMSGTQIINVENLNMVVIETDGVLVKPYILSTLSLAVGQRYTVIVKIPENQEYVRLINGCNKMMGYFSKSLWYLRPTINTEEFSSQRPDSSAISIKSLPRLNKHELFRELIPIDQGDLNSVLTSSLLDDVVVSLNFDYEFHSDQTTKNKYGTGMYKMGGKTLQEFIKEPIKLESSNKTVEIIINSIDHMRHPWHLHGHRFQLISIGNGREGRLDKDNQQGIAWDKYRSDLKYWKETGDTPTVRDSINIPGSSFAVIRFKLNTEGLWLVHCHVEWHMVKGLGFAFREIAQHDSVKIENGDPTKESEPERLTTSTNVVETVATKTNKLKVLLIYFIIMLLINGVFYLCVV
ncbi:similar to Saccharomyces cerevisiae YDR506C GMC1 Putative membrane-localized protein [Maudiozyma saulgeensis]|uniref:Similar to Saccharomyces cerevisiae YDR506C GMC1 Putative membrane-localized protein n=1 Tax=Maudiozyma saulgeensis TaxID=1789683 RepID=A0A1X7R6K9_9SACH|nr:similar to Saccharomyces cerevisiae YDR506C GMC1 Putative membrane-localized protein [Kazachstania saulgeensis]